MSSLRKLARRLYGTVFTAAMTRVNSGVQPLAPKAMRAASGASILHVVAPGASASRPSNASLAIEGDVLGVNYFALCRSSPYWPAARLFVIEPHETHLEYARAISAVTEIGGPVDVIVKGALSLSKAGAAAGLVRALSNVKGVRVNLANDMYLSDFDHSSFARAMTDYPAHTFCGSKSLLWTISFGAAAGYRQIVLHGFDFSQDYAYETDESDADAPRPNTWVSDEDTTRYVLNQVRALATTLGERGIELTQSECEGPLSRILPAYRQDHLKKAVS
jgi:hypothetical protein